MDLAMTTLFGGFQQPFYEAYAYYCPFPSNYREQWDICNLYPLLIHLNLFGSDLRRGAPYSPLLDRNLRSARLYLGNILHTIQRF
jgi:fructosamine-3-kinase